MSTNFCTRSVAAASLVSLVLGSAACTELPSRGSKAGGDPGPVTLTMGTDDFGGRPAPDQIAEFARQVERLSDGSMTIQPRLQALGPGNHPSWDQEVARLVESGDLDLGVIPSRAWDTEGVETLRPLSAPLLITTDAAMDAVVSDNQLAENLMGGLGQVGVTGLALVPEGMRHLFLYGPSELAADGIGGVVVRSPRSETTWAFFEALGARPTDDAEDPFAVAESSFELAPPGAQRTAVGDLALFPKINVVVVNTDVLDGLTDEQRATLEAAANATRDWAIATKQSDLVQAAAWCDAGQGAVTHLGAPRVDLMRSAAAGVMDDLSADPPTAALIKEIRRLVGEPGDGAVPRCLRSSDSALSAADLDPTGGDLPDGTYRAEYTDDYLRSRLRTAENVAQNHGVWTFQLDDGHWSFEQMAPDIQDSQSGIYEVRGSHLYWALEEGPVLHLRWATDEDGDLHFRQVRDLGADGDRAGQAADPDFPFPDFQFGLEWVKVK